MRTRRKIALVAGIVIVALVAILAAIPRFFGDRITARLQPQIEKSIDARVAWRRPQCAADFPNASVTVTDLLVIGVRTFTGDTLLATGALADGRLTFPSGGPRVDVAPAGHLDYKGRQLIVFLGAVRRLM